MQALLGQLRADDRGIARVRESADTRQRLRSLGYLSGAATSKTSYTDADDPKRLVALDREIDEVITRYQRGDLHGAIALGEEIVRRRPDMAVSLTHLAFLICAKRHQVSMTRTGRVSGSGSVAEVPEHKIGSLLRKDIDTTSIRRFSSGGIWVLFCVTCGRRPRPARGRARPLGEEHP
jgi:hypothetical protein